MNNDAESTLRHETAMFLDIMHEIAAAKRKGDNVDIWWSLDELACHALHCKTATIRTRAQKELERHRSQFRIEGCTDRFGSLDVFWNLPPNPFPYVEPGDDDGTGLQRRGNPNRSVFTAQDGTVFNSDDFNGDVMAAYAAFQARAEELANAARS